MVCTFYTKYILKPHSHINTLHDSTGHTVGFTFIKAFLSFLCKASFEANVVKLKILHLIAPFKKKKKIKIK